MKAVKPLPKRMVYCRGNLIGEMHCSVTRRFDEIREGMRGIPETSEAEPGGPKPPPHIRNFIIGWN